MTIQPAINEWSCALACVTSLVNDWGIPETQETLIAKFAHYFPEWKFRKGLLTRMEILRLLELIGLAPKYVLLTEDRAEFLHSFTKRINNYLGAFIITRKPTNHCLRILGCRGDIVHLMEPDQTKPDKLKVEWSFLDDRNPEYLLLCR